jgi:hypothetical protein
MRDDRLNLVGGDFVSHMFVVEGVGKRLGEAGVFERVNIVGDSLEEDVLEIGVMGDLVNLLQKLGEAAGFFTRGVIRLCVVYEVMIWYRFLSG